MQAGARQRCQSILRQERFRAIGTICFSLLNFEHVEEQFDILSDLCLRISILKSGSLFQPQRIELLFYVVLWTALVILIFSFGMNCLWVTSLRIFLDESLSTIHCLSSFEVMDRRKSPTVLTRILYVQSS